MFEGKWMVKILFQFWMKKREAPLQKVCCLCWHCNQKLYTKGASLKKWWHFLWWWLCMMAWIQKWGWWWRWWLDTMTWWQSCFQTWRRCIKLCGGVGGETINTIIIFNPSVIHQNSLSLFTVINTNLTNGDESYAPQMTYMRRCDYVCWLSEAQAQNC